MKATYKNRYNGISTFTLQEDGNILWETNFTWCRFGMPNDYTKAYDVYCKDHIEGFYDSERLTIEQFKVKVHEYDKENKIHPMLKYLQMVRTQENKIDMIDPSGGPYLTASDDMGRINEVFSGMIINEFVHAETGYLIIIEK
jgi:hypothetical protein